MPAGPPVNKITNRSYLCSRLNINKTLKPSAWSHYIVTAETEWLILCAFTLITLYVRYLTRLTLNMKKSD